MGRHGMRWEELRWVEMKCKCEVWSVGCEECNVKCEESVCIVPGSRAGHVLGQQHCNSFAQSTDEVWSVKCEVWSVQWEACSEVWSVDREECSVKWEVWSVKCEVCSVECEECSEKCEGRSGASNVTCETGHNFRRVHARTGLAGARRMQVL